jgi:hypothetical protein
VEGSQVTLCHKTVTVMVTPFFWGTPLAALRAAAWRPPQVNVARAGCVLFVGHRGVLLHRCMATRIMLWFTHARSCLEMCCVCGRGVVFGHALQSRSDFAKASPGVASHFFDTIVVAHILHVLALC